MNQRRQRRRVEENHRRFSGAAGRDADACQALHTAGGETRSTQRRDAGRRSRQPKTMR